MRWCGSVRETDLMGRKRKGSSHQLAAIFSWGPCRLTVADNDAGFPPDGLLGHTDCQVVGHQHRGLSLVGLYVLEEQADVIPRSVCQFLWISEAGSVMIVSVYVT